MQRCVLHHTVVFLVAFSLVNAANILDFLWDAENGEVEKREESAGDTSQSCVCNGPACMCCVDFNLTYIDLGGPGCVQMKYISQSEGILVNVSYGESLLHSEQVKGPNPEPTCMSLLANIAQVCARFFDLQPKDDGLRGCLLLEPKLLGDVTTSFNIGCFSMDPRGMKLEERNATVVVQENESSPGNTTESESEGFNEEELIAVVNESAEQGLAFFGNLLGLAFGKPEANNTNTETTTPISTSTDVETLLATSTNSPQNHLRKVKQLFKGHNEV